MGSILVISTTSSLFTSESELSLNNLSLNQYVNEKNGKMIRNNKKLKKICEKWRNGQYGNDDSISWRISGG